MRTLIITLVLSLLVNARPLFASDSTESYIRSLEGLLSAVETRDPSRPQLTLKLADALFNEAITLSSQTTLSQTDEAKLERTRRRAVQLYQDALSGIQGQFALPTGAAKAKIQFQVARIYSDQGNLEGAEKIWTPLAEFDAAPDIQRESLLRLAEVFENRNKPDSLKKAETYYKRALALCSNRDVCSYCHYRLAWVLEHQNSSVAAISEMKEALWDSKGQVREEALRDLINFISIAPGDDGKEALNYVEQLGAKLGRANLIGDLADAYFAAGNKKAGVYVLETVNRKSPSLKSYVRLLEENYGFRNWEQFNAELDGAILYSQKPGVESPDADAERILRRLTVQLDGERVSQPRWAQEFKKTVMFYLALFPKRNERAQMIDGWLAAETNDQAKMVQLKIWIADEKTSGHRDEENRLREMRAALAQKTNDYKVVIEETSALAPMAKTPIRQRELAYQTAYALYQSHDYTQALPHFQKLAEVTAEANAKPDKWAIQSENLALDILGQQKAYADVLKQVRQWTRDARFASWVQGNREQADELNDLKKVELSAEFQWATNLGTQAAALEVFHKDCQQDLLLPQSCSNAQVLAIKLGDQQVLIATLKKLGKKDEVAAEQEAAGEFIEAAQILEKNLVANPIAPKTYLKVALLYELGSDNQSRDRVLKLLVQHLATAKSLGIEEDLLLQTLTEAHLVTAATLKLAWKKENHIQLVNQLALAGQATPEMHRELIQSCTDMGAAWEREALSEMQKLDLALRKIHFAGKNSKNRFQARVTALKQLVDRGDCYLTATSPRMRAVLATILAKSQTDLADEIKASPIPDGVDDESKANLQKALAEMAQPFVGKAQSFSDLAKQQLDKIDNVNEKAMVQEKIIGSDEKLFAFELPAKEIPAHAMASASVPGSDILKTALQDLHRNANEKTSLERLKSYYEANGQARLAAYYQGRLLQLGEGVKQ